MAELVKPWNDGGSLTATYEGSGDGSAIFSSDAYEGIDREQSVVFRDVAESVAVERVVRQEGIRQQFVTSDGKVFKVVQGRYGVLKGGAEPEPPTPTETYTRLTYLESTGAQYINTGYVVQEDDVIEMQYVTTLNSGADKALFGCYDDNGDIWYSIYSNKAYARFGSDSSASSSNASQKNRMKMSRGQVDIDGTKVTLSQNNMPQVPLYLFARNNKNEGVGIYGYFKSIGCTISKASGEMIMDLKPCKRDSDGKVGMLDCVSGKFFTNQGSGEDFSYGGEARITEGYELIEYVAFNNDKIFDTGHYANERTYFELLFQRTDTSGADYIFGISSGTRVTGYLTSSGYWRYNSGYPTFNTNNKLLHYAYVSPGSTTVSGNTKTFSVGGAFTTAFTIPVGGHKPSSGVATPTYQGYIYYFRMKIDDEYVADYLPCKRLSDGVEGFWDCVTNTFVEPL